MPKPTAAVDAAATMAAHAATLRCLAAPSPIARNVAVALTGAAAVALAAQIAFTLPGTDVPQTAQTLAVMAVAGLAGPAVGSAAMIVYLLAGGLGLPVLANGASGLGRLTGPTGGFLLGFVPAAAQTGVMPFLAGAAAKSAAAALVVAWRGRDRGLGA